MLLSVSLSLSLSRSLSLYLSLSLSPLPTPSLSLCARGQGHSCQNPWSPLQLRHSRHVMNLAGGGPGSGAPRFTFGAAGSKPFPNPSRTERVMRSGLGLDRIHAPSSAGRGRTATQYPQYRHQRLCAPFVRPGRRNRADDCRAVDWEGLIRLHFQCGEASTGSGPGEHRRAFRRRARARSSAASDQLPVNHRGGGSDAVGAGQRSTLARGRETRREHRVAGRRSAVIR